MLLKLEKVNAYYGVLKILHDIDMDVREGELVVIMGPNGSGKSTLLKTIMGLLRTVTGSIKFQGEEIRGLPPYLIAELGISWVGETSPIFPDLTVLENLLVASYLPRARKKRRENLKMVFDLFPVLEERKNQRAGTLSGGERKMLSIACCLMTSPKLLLVDEPSLGLAPKIADTIWSYLRKLRDMGLTLLVVEENIFKALNMADRGYVLEHGKIVREGDAKTLLKDERVVKAYIGK
jgi:branched-chain amino acid transport system ATP-binding protein